MKVIAVIEDEGVICRILAHLHLLAPGDGPRAPPRNAGLRELIYEPVFDDLPWMDPASLFPAGGLRHEPFGIAQGPEPVEGLSRAARKGEVCPETPGAQPDRSPIRLISA